MKRITKIISIIIISILLTFNIPLYSKALESVIESGNDFLNLDSENVITMTPEEDKLQNISDSVSGVLLTIAVAVTLISVVIMGINFIIQSVEEKAKIKESMIPWVIGIFVSFGAYGIWKITMQIFYQL